MTAVLPDAAPTNWVDRHAPPGLRPWLKLGRLDRPTGIWLLMLPGWQGIALADAAFGRAPNPVLLVLFFLGATLMRAAGCAYNDIIDRDIDAKVARTAGRPIPAGQISVKAAWVFVIGCSLISVLILLNLNGLSVILGVASLALVAAYPFMKRITWWPQAWLGLTFNWGALLGYAAAQNLFKPLNPLSPEIFSLYGAHATCMFTPCEPLHFLFFWIIGGNLIYVAPAILLYGSDVFWTLGYDTIYAVQDVEDDALAGVKSSARRLGRLAPWAVFGFYVVTVALVGAVGWITRLGPFFWPLGAMFALTLFRQARRLKLDNPAGALALFKSNTLAGALLFLAIAFGALRLS